ncbi:hypothetical protein FOXG_20669 [Fusarium oxysporum f. sp. lycopersici 4287]|uniref:Uncharacterized protein n=1 Tax=Fusarium oxysporum f. sp. lycopersici (strain 4287 / CBS 123668 / FGSC 9935 / NRRL 34936) TaxID=426428 RepID=A0A0J9VMZ1_FUSO4|nr:hypothetical protein FOXG_20669 [Fusarium oxysporum f. sp. lycopersici 4287]KNB12509.1 hypothetical protein FOXG_20669 [Fusarium oxysporum f. sp. lycopersici 4287]
MTEMILQATFARKPHHLPDILSDADRLQAACGKECEVDLIANKLQVTMEQEKLFEDWELVPGWTWKPEKKEHCCRIL